jgi:hypothetical protein
MALTRSSWLAAAALAVLVVVATGVLMHAPAPSEAPAGVSAPTSDAEPPVPPVRAVFGVTENTGRLERDDLDEVSGLAASRRRSDLLWVHNDSGARPRLYAIGADGRDRGAVDVSGASNVDWEDLASFELDGVPYLLIADVGDNAARRRSVTLYVIEEPELIGDRFGRRARARVAWSIDVVYDGGPLDCEGVAVDVPGGRVLLVSKRTVPLRLYEVPLRATTASDKPVVASLVGDVFGIPQPVASDLAEDPQFGRFRSQATALDVSSDARELIVVTYGNAYRFSRAEGEGWREAVARAPDIVLLPRMVQTEAGAYSADGRSLWVTTERRPAPLYRVDRLPEDPPDVPL